MFPAGILVDPETGRRIVNEWGDRRERADAMMRAGHPCVGIIDAVGVKRDAASLQDCLRGGKVQQYQDLGALAAAYGMPAAVLADTVKAYNSAVADGRSDAFGKALGQGAFSVASPPFYAIRLYPKVHYTPGGVRIDQRARVVDLHGKPIPRLFAAGEVTGGVHGASRLGSCALTECLVFGRIAGREAARLTPQASV